MSTENAATQGSTMKEAVSPSAAFAHLFKTMVGAGIFFLPAAFKNAGWFVAIVLGTVFTAIVVDITVMLVKCRDLLKPREDGEGDLLGSKEECREVDAGEEEKEMESKHPKEDTSRAKEGCETSAVEVDTTTTTGKKEDAAYPALTNMVLGPKWATALRWSLVLVQLCWCLVYIQLAAGMIAEIIGAGPASPVYVVLCFILSAGLFPFTLLSRHLSVLAYATFVAVCCLCIVGIITVTDLTERLQTDGIAPSAVAVASPTRWIIFIPTMLSALGGLPAVLPIHDSMDPKHHNEYFAGLFAKVGAVVGALYVSFGMFGYLTFGAELTASLVSLETGATVRLALSAAVLLSVPIQFVPAIEVIDAEVANYRAAKDLPPSNLSEDGVELEVWEDKIAFRSRIFVMVELAVIAASVGADTVGIVVSFVGATIVNFEQIIVPLVMYLLCMLEPINSGEEAEKNFAVRLPSGYVPKLDWTLPWIASEKAKKGDAAPLRWSVHGRAWVYLILAALTVVQGTLAAIQDAITVVNSRK